MSDDRKEKTGKRGSRKARDAAAEPAWRGGPSRTAIAKFVRTKGMRWLAVNNVVGVSVGPKLRGGVPTGEMAVIFDVIVKFAELPDIVRADSRHIPDTIDIEGHILPTDIVEARPEPHGGAVDLKARMDPVRGGCSVGDIHETGTLGAIVRDRDTGALLGLSNWHVLASSGMNNVVQPGSGDATGPVGNNGLGHVVRSVFDTMVDGAVTTIQTRTVDPRICNLDVAVRSVAAPEVHKRVVKCGKATGVTHGIISNDEKVVKLAMPVDYPYSVSVCIISPDPEFPSPAISAFGDSGSCWMLCDDDGNPTETMVGLHIAGDGDSLAYACHADRVFDRLAIVPVGAAVANLAETTVQPADIPAFAAVGDAPARYEVIARNGLRVRGGPGTQFDILAARGYRDVVNVLRQQGDWMLVDLEGDGKTDGFMLSSFLRPIDGR